jgi:peptide/nickel transport system permease protein
MFFITVWLGATILFIIPRLGAGDPMSAMLSRMRAQGAHLQNSQTLINAWRARFGLDQPVYIQYLHYLFNMVRGDLGYSLTYFPTTVSEMIGRALPWTICLLGVVTILDFIVGTTIGALMGWRGTPKMLKSMLPFTLVFTSIPSFMLAIFFIFVFGFVLKWFPYGGGYGQGIEVGLNLPFISSAIYHSILPAASILVVSIGFQAMGMRGMMISIDREDYLVLAKIKGLIPRWIFLRYAVRNALLPQLTALALNLGGIVAGATLVEMLFSYPGMGYLMYRGIISKDYALIGGIGFILITTTAVAVLLLDLVYPIIDPRITYKKK